MLAKNLKIALLAVSAVLLLGAGLLADETNLFRPTDKAFYADEALVNFVRPGLVMKISKAEIAADGTVKAWVKFTDPKGLGLDREGIQTPGPISASLLLANIPAGQTQYVSYITRTRTGTRTVVQATGENTGTWQKIADGEYTYTFVKKLPADFDKNATHTIGIYGSRNLSEFDLSTNYADATYNFVPSGAAVTQVRDIIRTSSCNKCHDQLGLHGGARRSVEVCIICHTPQTPDSRSDNTTDMKVMVHKIHMGSSLPSVIAGKKYMVAGQDYSTVANPSPNMACVACHEPKEVSGATQADVWTTRPTRDTCGSCHDNVNFATGENHANQIQVSDNLCKNCHQPRGEIDFDTSIQGAHVVPDQSSLLPGVVFTINAVDNAAPGKNPIVTFTVKDKKGNPVQIAQMSSLRLYMGGPSSDIVSYVREDVRKAQGSGNGTYFWTFAAAIPANATGSYQFGIEGYNNVKVLAGTAKEQTIRDFGKNAVFTASLGGPVEPRRIVVTTAKCERCHYRLSFHGGNRNEAQMCTFCHNPTLVVTATGAPAESFNYVNFIHRIHAEEVRYPGRLNNCSQCHEGDSQSLPLKEGLVAVANPEAPGGTALPATNACTACHVSEDAWSHATANTTSLGESCTVCHSKTSSYSVSKVHAQ
jgi:OmcA/MtrC family decaheme c-type cytochrome